MNNNDYIDKLSQIDYIKYSNYLEQTGWINDGKIKDIASVWHRPETINNHLELLLPIDYKIKDFNTSIINFIRVLSEYENREYFEIINDIIEIYFDLIKIRVIGSDVSDGNILIEDGILLYDNIKELLSAITLSTLRKKNYFTGNKPQEAIDYLSNVKLGQTEKGSYIINIISPIRTDVDNLITDIKDVSFSRLVVKNLSNSIGHLLSTMDDIKKENDFSLISKSVEYGVSANLCQAIADISGKTRNKDIDISIHATNKYKLDNEISTNFKILKNDIPMIEEAGKYLKNDKFYENYEIKGSVKRLARDDRHQDGEIVLSSMIEDKTRSVHIHLPFDFYQIAITAHKNQSTIKCLGDLHISTKKTVLLNCKNFRIDNENKLF